MVVISQQEIDCFVFIVVPLDRTKMKAEKKEQNSSLDIVGYVDSVYNQLLLNSLMFS